MSSKEYPDFVKFQLPALVWMALIFSLSCVPGSDIAPMEFPYAHLIAHTMLYGVLYYFAYRAMKFQEYIRWLNEFSLVIALLFVMLYGASDEFHQSFVPGRTEEFKDFAIDVGAAIIVLAAIVIKDKFRLDKKKLKES
ncbi:MAG: VanZ family protein [Bacteroidetes bacterium]|nr:VanZ family protein [Bacteroidota bacterium]